VDINSTLLRDSIGTHGTLANRLLNLLEETGDLKEPAVDEDFAIIWEPNTDLDLLGTIMSGNVLSERDQLIFNCG